MSDWGNEGAAWKGSGEVKRVKRDRERGKCSALLSLGERRVDRMKLDDRTKDVDL